MKKSRIRYYSSFTDDFEQNADRDHKLPPDYKWIRKDIGSRLLSSFIYTAAIIFSYFYCYLFLHLRVRGKKNLKGIKGGYFIYGNHSQPVGDVFIPALCVLPKRIYTVVSTANYGIPIIRKILPYLGALPVVNSLQGIKELSSAIAHRIKGGHPIVIYPEAHVWEYYTGIRPFPETSFKFAVKLSKPSFSMTVTYRKSRIFKKPVTEVFIDGPFYPTGRTAQEKAEDLKNQIYCQMKERSLNSNCEYIKYSKL